MKMPRVLIVIASLFVSISTSGCTQDSTSSPTASADTSGLTETSASEPTVPGTAAPAGIIAVFTTADTGEGSLRQALEQAQAGSTIVFEPGLFDPNAPKSIMVESALPDISQGGLTIDASNAGVILDGSLISRDSWVPGLQIVSDGNIIRGMHVINFTGAGIVVAGHGRNNTIGGSGIGQGNWCSGNGIGIGLWDLAANNAVIGNLIGDDSPQGTGAPGNHSSGVWITEGATDNVIGPDNIIAYNSRFGIEVERSASVRNHFTENSIYDNGGVGIRLWRGGNAGLGAPVPGDFDWNSGSLSGTACADCVVEIFSDGGDEGAVYEGQETADGSGIFTLSKGAAFSNPNVTLTATDADGNTSEFSRPIGAGSPILTLQKGNSLPKFRTVDMPSQALADNRVGMSYNGVWRDVANDGLPGVVDEVTNLGAKRIDTSLYEVEPPIDWSTSETEIPLKFDQFIDDLVDNGVAVDYILHYWDKEGHANGTELSTPRFKTEEQVQAYLEYVRFIVRHFKGRVRYYTIWSEPDNCGKPEIKCVEPEDYTKLANETIDVIHQEDPQAKTVLAPVVLFFAREYLFTVLRSEVVSKFDVISWHGIYDVAPDEAFYGDYYYEYPDIVQEIKKTASAQGFQGEYWATELTWCSEEYPLCHPADQPWGQQATDLLAAKYYARGIVMHRGMDFGIGIGGFQPAASWSYPTIRHLNTLMDGASPIHLPVRIANEPPQVKSYGFSLPNGDILFALWTDGVAVEDNPGVYTDLIFPGLFAKKAVGIDVLNGIEQELVTEVGDADLVIPGMMLTDYPIFIRFSSVTVTP